MYQLETLYRNGASALPFDEAKYLEGPTSVVDFADLKVAEIDDVIFVSVPVTTSAASCEQLRDSILAALSDKRVVMILTHNIELLKAKKLKPTETAKVLSNIQEMAHAQTQPEQRLVLTPEELNSRRD